MIPESFTDIRSSLEEIKRLQARAACGGERPAAVVMLSGERMQEQQQQPEDAPS
jgi:hypothetical protein